jgi:hypothetical protein
LDADSNAANLKSEIFNLKLRYKPVAFSSATWSCVLSVTLSTSATPSAPRRTGCAAVRARRPLE